MRNSEKPMFSVDRTDMHTQSRTAHGDKTATNDDCEVTTGNDPTEGLNYMILCWITEQILYKTEREYQGWLPLCPLYDQQAKTKEPSFNRQTQKSHWKQWADCYRTLARVINEKAVSKAGCAVGGRNIAHGAGKRTVCEGRGDKERNTAENCVCKRRWDKERVYGKYFVVEQNMATEQRWRTISITKDNDRWNIVVSDIMDVVVVTLILITGRYKSESPCSKVLQSLLSGLLSSALLMNGFQCTCMCWESVRETWRQRFHWFHVSRLYAFCVCKTQENKHACQEQ